jgi:hypothetical protein
METLHPLDTIIGQTKLFILICLASCSRNETKRCRRRRAVKISAAGEGAECKYALSPIAPDKLGWLIMGQIQKTFRYFLSKKKGLSKPKKHLTLRSV